MSGDMDIAQYGSWRNLNVMFLDRAREFGDRPFLWARKNGAYEPLSWTQTVDVVSRLSRGLRALGIEPGDRVVLVSENRPEWVIAELAIMAAGAIAVPAYTTNTVDDHEHILDNVGAAAAIVSTRKLAQSLFPAAHRNNACKLVVAMEPPDRDQKLGEIDLHLWDDVLAKGAAAPDDVAEMAGRAARSDTAVIIHTSGTRGAPRGVMLSHGAILANCMGAWGVIGPDLDYGREVFLSFLPLSHAYEHMAGQYLPMSIGAQIYYAQSIDTLLSDMADARPTVMTAVPRLYEVMYGRIQKTMAGTKGLKRWLFDKALELGARTYEKPGSLTVGERLADALAERAVRAKMRGRFGGRLKFFVSGGAPLNYDIGLFFTALGVKLLQGYGQTEAAPLISVNPARGTKIHTVGPPVTGVELKIAGDGEICVRGELLMNGYYGDKDATNAVLRGGWLHTGDIGKLDADGHITITDRKKDIIVTSGGDNISPQRVEGFLTLQPEIAQAMVYGDFETYLSAVIVADPETLKAWAKAHDKVADLTLVADDSGLHDHIGQAVERVNRELSNVERVRRFILADREFTTDNEMLTPSMKIRRHVIKRVYGAALDALYERGPRPTDAAVAPKAPAKAAKKKAAGKTPRKVTPATAARKKPPAKTASKAAPAKRASRSKPAAGDASAKPAS